LHKKFYDPKTLKYYLPDMFKVEDDKMSDYTIEIPWIAQDCFDFVEYTAFDQILYHIFV
jgi:hypothetical protein